MHTLSSSVLKALTQPQAGFCVSLYLPTQRTGAEYQQNRIRLRHALCTAEERLQAEGLRPPNVRRLLAPVEALVTDSGLWRQCDKGLVAFASEQLFQRHCVPLAYDETVVVARSFYLEPLLPALAGDGQFFVLALSQNSVRLFEGSRDALIELPGTHLPRSLAEVFKDVEAVRRELQFRSAVAGGRAGGSAIYYHSGDMGQAAKDRLLHFCRMVDQGLHEELKDENQPLVLAGVAYVLAHFREVSRYARLIAGEVVGSPDRSSAQALHARAWPLVQPYFERRQAEAVAHFSQLAGGMLVSANLGDICAAAGLGRVEAVFVPSTRQERLAESMWNADRHTADNRLGIAAIETLLNGGAIYMLAPEDMPIKAECAAIFRY